MEVILLTTLFSILFAILFLLLFIRVRQDEGSCADQDALLPFTDDEIGAPASKTAAPATLSNDSDNKEPR